MKICANKECAIVLTIENCYIKTDGRLRSYCKNCHNNKTISYSKISSKKPDRKNKVNKRSRASRKDPAKLIQIIWQDTRGSDKKHNRENNLTKEFIAKCVAQPCTYCGESNLRITLDRIDNSKGHIEANIVPACIRCNYARRSMPYEAWLLLVPGLREAKEKGLFGSWTGRCR